MLETSGFWKYWQEDRWAEGVVGEELCADCTGLFFSAETPELLLKQAATFFGGDAVGDACDEPGRLDVIVLENDDGYAASEGEVELWKLGKQRLWCATYTTTVYETTRKLARLT